MANGVKVSCNDPSHEARYRALDSAPEKRVTYFPKDGHYEVWAFCPVPFEGSKFRVLREHWDDESEMPARYIFEWEYVPEAGGEVA